MTADERRGRRACPLCWRRTNATNSCRGASAACSNRISLGDIREIVVVDDARSPSTAGIVAEVQACYPATELVLLEGRSSGPTVAGISAWRRATGEVIAFIDDDARAASRDWLRTGLEPFRDARVTGVSGAVTVPIEGLSIYFQRNVQHLEDGVFLTCNAFYRRTALEAVDGFDERFTFPFREDSDLYYRVEALGGVMVREPLARVVHPAPRGRFGVSARLQRYSTSNALLYKKHPERYRRRCNRGRRCRITPW